MKLKLNMSNEEFQRFLLLEFSKNDKSILDVIEILSNLMVQIGFQDIENQGDAIQSIADDIKSKGDTLHNAIARQGMLMLTWMKSERNDV